MGAGHIGAVSAVAFGRRGAKFLVSGGADRLLKVSLGGIRYLSPSFI